MDGYSLDKIRQELASEEDFSLRDNFPRSWAVGVSDWGAFLAAMDGYALDKIRQELTSEEDFLVSDNFPRSWAVGVSYWMSF